MMPLMSTIQVPLMGIPGEHHDTGTMALCIPCKAGNILVYYGDLGAYLNGFVVYFPTLLKPGASCFMSGNLLDVKHVILDYLSKEEGRSETKQVTF